MTFMKSKIVIIDDDKTYEKKAIIKWGYDKVTVKFQSHESRFNYPEYEVTSDYDKISDLTYERTSHWRVVSAILWLPLVLFSKRKHRWFSWNDKDAEGNKRSVLLRIDKNEEKIYRRQVPSITGLELSLIIDR